MDAEQEARLTRNDKYAKREKARLAEMHIERMNSAMKNAKSERESSELRAQRARYLHMRNKYKQNF